MLVSAFRRTVASPRSICHAAMAMSPFTVAVSQSVSRVPKMLEQEEGGGETAGDCAQGIERIQRRDVATPASSSAHHAARAAAGNVPPIAIVGTASTRAVRARRAIVSDDEAQTGGAAGGDIQRAHQREEPRTRGRRQRDDGFELRVQEQRARVNIRAAAQQQPAGAQAAGEDGQHGGGRRGRRAKDQPELPEPANLVDQGTKARAEQQRRDRRGVFAHARLSRVRSARASGCAGAQ